MVLPHGRSTVQDVKIFGLQHRAASERTKRPWIVRWAVEGRQHSRSFRTRAEGDRYRSMLFEAQRKGESFDQISGEPSSWQPAVGDMPIHLWARRWLAEQWPEWQPRTRNSAVEAIARLVPLLVSSRATAPPSGLRSYLVRSLGADQQVLAGDEREHWLDRFSLPLSVLNRELLSVVEGQLGVGDDGQLLAPSTASRYRKVSRACIARAAELEVIPVDPWPPAPRGRSRRKAVRLRRSVDIRALPGPAAMAAAIDAVATHQPGSLTYQAMTAVAYYAGLRPSEVVMLRGRSLVLPMSGWGRIEVREADISFDEPGEPKTGPRTVPIPPVLVARLRAFVKERSIGLNDLLFRTAQGKMPRPSNWHRAWQRALQRTELPPMRVYDCRHAAATTWLGAGVPLGEVARRLGHSVETLVSTYVGSLTGDEDVSNERIELALTPAIASAEEGFPPRPFLVGGGAIRFASSQAAMSDGWKRT